MREIRPLVSIIVPTHNRLEMLLRLLKSIYANTYKKVEIIVVDDASTDNTASAVKRKYEKVNVIKNKKNLFTAASRNIGIKHAKGELLFFIDDDNILDKKAIEILLRAFSVDNSLGEAGLVNYNANKRNAILWVITKRNMYTTKTTQPRTLAEFRNKKKWDTVDVPNAFMVRSSTVRKENIFFKEKWGIMYEESDFAYRIRNAGYKVKVIRDAKIFHDIERKTKGGSVMDYMYHFMTDTRRPYVTARNRILFHALYSTKLQQLFIFSFWIWFFAAYYSYKIIFYSGVGTFSLLRRLQLVGSYYKGILVGLSEIRHG